MVFDSEPAVSDAAGLVVCACLDISLVVVMIRFRQTSRSAAVILIPYMLWILFATYLNYGFCRLN